MSLFHWAIDGWFLISLLQIARATNSSTQRCKATANQWGISSQSFLEWISFCWNIPQFYQMNSRNWIKHDFFSGDSSLVIIGRMNCWMSSFFSVQTVDLPGWSLYEKTGALTQIHQVCWKKCPAILGSLFVWGPFSKRKSSLESADPSRRKGERARE